MKIQCWPALALLPATIALAQNATAPATSQAAQYTMSVTSQLVVVDVTVTDKHGKPLHGLKAGDFVLNENGQPQQVRSFEEHTGLSDQDAAKVPAQPKLPPGDFTNFVATPPNGALDIILIDRLNTSVSDQVFLLRQLKEYAKHAPPDARIAVFGLTDHLILLKGFTQDPAAFAKAVEFASDPKASHLRDDGLGHGGSEALDANDDFLSSQGGFSGVIAALQSFEEQYQSYTSQISAKMTLDALNTLGRAMIAIPGRKNLIWFSGNFPEQFFPGTGDPLAQLSGNGDFTFPYATLDAEYRETINLLSRSRIAVYPVDAQGLRTSQVNNASQHGFGTVKDQQTRGGLAGNVAEQKEFSSDAGEHLAMERIAFDSGGQAFFNDNDLVKAAHDAVGSGSDFYTLAYAPSDNNPKHLYRNIAVKGGDGDVRLGYRRGYYYSNVPDAKAAVTTDAPAGATPPPPSAMRQAMNLGGPQPTEILLRIHAAPVSGEPEAKVVNGNSPNPDAKKVTGPYRKYQVNFAASARNVAFRHGADQIYHADVDFLTCVYDARGVLINSQSDTMHTAYDVQKLAAVLRGGLLFDQRISVPARGLYFLRVIVHDNTSGRVGAIELPVPSVSGLPPLPSDAVPAAGGGR